MNAATYLLLRAIALGEVESPSDRKKRESFGDCTRCGEAFGKASAEQTMCAKCEAAKRHWDSLLSHYESEIKNYEHMQEHGLLDVDMLKPTPPTKAEF